MKMIPLKELKQLVVLPRLETDPMVHRLGKYYCMPMNHMGQCSTTCQNCKAHLCNIFERLALADPSRDPIASLVHACREEIADIAELTETSAKPAKGWLGQPVNKSIFELYEGSIRTPKAAYVTAFDVESCSQSKGDE